MPNGETRHIEVKGRHIEADTVTVTANEVLARLLDLNAQRAREEAASAVGPSSLTTLALRS